MTDYNFKRIADHLSLSNTLMDYMNGTWSYLLASEHHPQ